MTDIETLHAEMREWRRHLHANPEFGFAEQATAAFVADKLRTTSIRLQTMSRSQSPRNVWQDFSR